MRLPCCTLWWCFSLSLNTGGPWGRAGPYCLTQLKWSQALIPPQLHGGVSAVPLPLWVGSAAYGLAPPSATSVACTCASNTRAQLLWVAQTCPGGSASARGGRRPSFRHTSGVCAPRFTAATPGRGIDGGCGCTLWLGTRPVPGLCSPFPPPAPPGIILGGLIHQGLASLGGCSGCFSQIYRAM